MFHIFSLGVTAEIDSAFRCTSSKVELKSMRYLTLFYVGFH
jgi:hypothetical protein